MTEREATAVLASTSAAWIQGALRRGGGTVPLPLLSLASTSETARPSFLLASNIDLISLSGLSLLLSTQFLKLFPPPREWPRKRVKGPVGQNVLDDCHFLCDPGQGTFPTCKMWGWHPLKGLLWGHKGVTWGRAMPGPGAQHVLLSGTFYWRVSSWCHGDIWGLSNSALTYTVASVAEPQFPLL